MDLYRPMDLNQRALAVAGGSLPFHPSVSADCRDMPIPLAETPIAGRFDRIGARRNDDGGIAAVVDDRVVGGLSVIGAVGGELSYPTVDLVEQGLHLRDVARVLAFR